MASQDNNQTLRLIVIDSDSQTRIDVKRWAGEKGVRVIGEAENTKLGLRLVRNLDPDVVLLELAASSAQTMEAVKRIGEELPNTRVILSSHEASPQLILSCIRAGAHEFVARPIEPSELEKALDHIRKLETMSANRRKRGKVLSVFSTKGGIGATSFVANLGAALAGHADVRTVLVDLSFQMGDLGLLLDQPAGYSLTDALEEGAVDEAKLRSTLSEHRSGVSLLTVAASPEAGEDVTREHMLELFGALTAMFDFVIVDVGRHLDDRTVEVLELSQTIFMMSALDLPTVRNACRYLDIFDRLEFERDKIRVVVNRVDKKSRLTVKDLESTINMDVFWTIPNDSEPMSLAIDTGVPAVINSPKRKVSQSFRSLADRLCEMAEEDSSVSIEATG